MARRRIRTTKEYVELLAKLYNVSFYIAQKYYNKANGILEDAKMYIKLYTLGCKTA
jgi:hypothetical protein